MKHLHESQPLYFTRFKARFTVTGLARNSNASFHCWLDTEVMFTLYCSGNLFIKLSTNTVTINARLNTSISTYQKYDQLNLSSWSERYSPVYGACVDGRAIPNCRKL